MPLLLTLAPVHGFQPITSSGILILFLVSWTPETEVLLLRLCPQFLEMECPWALTQWLEFCCFLIRPICLFEILMTICWVRVLHVYQTTMLFLFEMLAVCHSGLPRKSIALCSEQSMIAQSFGTLCGRLGKSSWFLSSGSVPAVATTYRMNQWIEDLSVSLPPSLCISDFHPLSATLSFKQISKFH